MKGCTPLKKLTLVALACLGLANTAHATVADSSDPRNTRWYTVLGAQYYMINLPTYRLPITFGNWSATIPPTLPPTGIDLGFNAADTQAGNMIIEPTLNIGYYLKNGSVIMPKWLDNEAFEIDYSQFNRATKSSTNYTGATGVDMGAAYGIVWAINNPTVPIYQGGAERIVSSYIHASIHYHDLDLLFKATIKNLPDYMRSTARIGLVATTLDQDYSYSINATTKGMTHLPIQPFGSDTIRARYYGITLGDQFEVQYAPAFSAFIDAAVQGLYETTSMTANQTPDSAANPLGIFNYYANNIRIVQSNNKYTYRGQAQVGINLYPKLFKNQSPAKISAFVGIDEWGDVPEETTITTVGASIPHITNHTMRNYFTGLSVTVPIN